jgi:rubrerythrin
MTSDRIITRECQVVAGDTYDVILEKAMLIEKNSVFFYTTVKEIMQSRMSAGAVDRIIHEEVSHFSMLSEALKEWHWQK